MLVYLSFLTKKGYRMLKKLLLWLVCTCIVWLPSTAFILTRSLLKPEGFWQNFVLTGAGIYILVGLQFLLCVAWIFASVLIFFADSSTD